VMPFWNACRRRCRYLEKYGKKNKSMITVSNHHEPCRKRGILRNVAVGIGSSHHENGYKGKHVTPAPSRKEQVGHEETQGIPPRDGMKGHKARFVWNHFSSVHH
jgi:hypothetical protein